MAHATPTRRHRQARRLQQQLARAPGLPFADLLPADQVRQALRDEGVTFRDRLFSPLVTVSLFLSPLLSPPPPRPPPPAPRPRARRPPPPPPPPPPHNTPTPKPPPRLPQAVLHPLTRLTGRQVQEQAPAGWRWEGRTLKVVD